MATGEPKTECRMVEPGKKPTKIPTWKFDLLRAAILGIVRAAGPDGFATAGLKEALAARIPAADLDRLGSLGWHMMAVKLEMEVAGDLKRLPGAPQRLAVV